MPPFSSAPAQHLSTFKICGWVGAKLERGGWYNSRRSPLETQGGKDQGL